MPARSRSAAEALRPLLDGGALAQLLRFVVAGVGVTAFSTLVYLGLAVELRVTPMLANAMSHMLGVAVGYTVHSRWSFRAGSDAEATMIVRFAIVSGLGFALNSVWVWAATHAFALPAWAPVPAMVFVTPLASFALNRCWVFAER